MANISITMELDKALKGRRTIRKFANKDVSWLLIAEILDAGRLAPSSGNLQNWYFIVVRNKEIKEKVVKQCDSYNHWALQAPVLIVVCADLDRAKRMFGSRGENLYSIQNCANAAVQMMLKAHDLSLGSAWIGSFDDAGLSKVLEIEQGVKLQVVLAIGYPAEEGKFKRADLSTMVFFDKFGEMERTGNFAMLPLSVPLKRNLEPMKERLKTSFEDEGLGEHKDKLRKFVERFSRKRK